MAVKWVWKEKPFFLRLRAEIPSIWQQQQRKQHYQVWNFYGNLAQLADFSQKAKKISLTLIKLHSKRTRKIHMAWVGEEFQPPPSVSFCLKILEKV